jgi:TPR repeat protein
VTYRVLPAAIIGALLCVAARIDAQARPGQQACRAGESSEACFRRGLELAEEAGIARRDAEKKHTADVLDSNALSLFQSACARDEADACYFAGRLVATPRERTLDPNVIRFEQADSIIAMSQVEAARLFRRGCYVPRAPSAAACNALGDSYTYGNGEPIQLDSAIKLYERGCNFHSASACYRWGKHLEEHPELGPGRRFLAYQLAERACSGGSPYGCVNAAFVIDTALYRVPDAQLNTPAARRKADTILQHDRDGCSKWIAVACNNIGALFSHGRYGVPSGLSAAQRMDSVRYYYQLACDGVPIRIAGSDTTRSPGHGIACKNLGDLSLTDVHPDTAAAIVQYRKGCLLLEQRACAELALKEYMIHHDSADVALLRTVTVCNEGIAVGCNYAGWLLRQTAFQGRVEESKVYTRRACDLEYAWSCYQLGDLEKTPSIKAKFHRRACDLHEGWGCFSLALILEKNFSQQDPAMTFYERACEEGLATGCWEGKRLRRALGDILHEGLDRAHACRLEPKQYCKKPDPAS